MDASDLHTLVLPTVRGDLGAWRTLQARLLPKLEHWARSHRSMRHRKLASSPDDVREVVVATLERLRANDFANLRRFSEKSGTSDDAAFEYWVYGCLSFAVREHLRARFGRLSQQNESSEAKLPNLRDVNTLASPYNEEAHHRERTGPTGQLSLNQIMRYVEENFAADEACAMRLLVEHGASSEDIARALGLSSVQDASRLIHTLKERLRKHFRDA